MTLLRSQRGSLTNMYISDQSLTMGNLSMESSAYSGKVYGKKMKMKVDVATFCEWHLNFLHNTLIILKQKSRLVQECDIPSIQMNNH